LFRQAPAPAEDMQESERRWLRTQEDALRHGSEALLERVPRLPSLMPRVLAAINDPDRTSARELAGLIETDPVLAANVLAVVNGPALRIRREPVQSLEQAVVILGLPGMREVVAAAAISPIVSFGRDSRLNAEAVKGLWPASLEAALASRDAARAAGCPGVFESYLAALTHASGLATLLRSLDSLQCAAPSVPFFAALERLSRRYAVVIARHWALPEATLHALGSWSEGARADACASLLDQAVLFVRASALRQQGALAEEPFARLIEQYCPQARLWRRESESS
jgi:HD-like signal output (HDOD) protein